MKQYQIPEELVNNLINYLSKRPYVEVYQGLQALQSLEPIAEEKGVTDPNPVIDEQTTSELARNQEA